MICPESVILWFAESTIFQESFLNENDDLFTVLPVLTVTRNTENVSFAKKNNNNYKKSCWPVLFVLLETWMNFYKTNFCYSLSTLGFALTSYLRTSLLCCWNDARSYESLRYGSLWDYFSRLTTSLWFNNCCRYFD